MRRFSALALALGLLCSQSAYASGVTAGGVYAPTIADGVVLFSSTTPGVFSYTVDPNAPGFVWIDDYAPGGGGACKNVSAGAGGGGGGYVRYHTAVSPGTTVIGGTIGTAGLNASSIGAGTAATNSTVTSPSLTAGGGQGGSGSVGGAGGTASGGNVTNTAGSTGSNSGSGGSGGGPGGVAAGGSGGENDIFQCPGTPNPQPGQIVITAKAS